MTAYLNNTSYDAYAVCPKCGERIEFVIGHEALGTKISLQCMACGTVHDGVLVAPASGGTDIAPEMVNHPAHYQSETGLEVIDVMEAFTADLKGAEAIATSNVIKYICRWKKKNGLEDLKKARVYLDRLIKHVEKIKEENDCHDQSRNHQ